MKQSGSSSSMAMRRMRQQGQKPGDQPGQTPGANAAGAPPMKPAKPSDRHALAGGKDIWGHLPDELRQEMENVFKEEALPSQGRADPALLPVGCQAEAGPGRMNHETAMQVLRVPFHCSSRCWLSWLCLRADASWPRATARTRARKARNPWGPSASRDAGMSPRARRR